MRDALDSAFGFVTRHNVLILVLMLLLTAGVVTGASQLQMQSNGNQSGAVGDTEVAQKMEYVQNSYEAQNESNASDTKPAVVYVRDEDNALSKDALIDSLRFQQTVVENGSVAASLGDRRVVGVANVIAMRAAGDRRATLDEQIAALEATSESEMAELVRATLTGDSSALQLMPNDYEPGTATAESHRMLFQFADGDSREAATAALHEAADERSNPEYFTTGEHARADSNAQYMQNTLELLVPAALLLILVVLAFSYRDFVDVVVGFTGVVLSVLWMFGIMGWLQIPAGMSLIIGPVLIVGLSVDYGLHVFMRYREERDDDEGVRAPMGRGLSSVAIALGLVTLTAMVGFMANATTDFVVIKQLSYAITLGVLSTFLVSLTLVPALKVTVDNLLERFGFDRQKRPLGKTKRLEPLLESGARLARRGAPVVIVLALVVGSAGAVAWVDLDRQSVQQSNGDIAEWKQDIPGPLGWDVSEESQQFDYVGDHYRAAQEDDRTRSTVLIEGTVTDPAALQSVQAIHEAATESQIVYKQGESVPLRSPLTVMATVAQQDDGFARQFENADTDDDGVPDQKVQALYDALYATAPEKASNVIDREEGTYQSVRVVVPVQPGTTIAAQAEGMQEVAAAGDTSEDVSTIAVGMGTLNEAELSQTADNILETLVIALVAVSVILTLVYRIVTGSASLGAITAVPIALVAALVIGGMWVLGVPLTLLTALLLSLIIGIGIDYNIHISDRFAQELERGETVQDALKTATTGTGGALLGSTLTSVGAFSALLLHPHPQLQSFGTLVVLAMLTSFLVAVFVLPSMLTMWARRLPQPTDIAASTGRQPASSDD